MSNAMNTPSDNPKFSPTPEAKVSERVRRLCADRIRRPQFITSLEQLCEELERCETSIHNRRGLRDGLVDLFISYPFVRIFELSGPKHQEEAIQLVQEVLKRLERFDPDLGIEIKHVLKDIID